jgi:hypothetical protein
VGEEKGRGEAYTKRMDAMQNAARGATTVCLEVWVSGVALGIEGELQQGTFEFILNFGAMVVVSGLGYRACGVVCLREELGVWRLESSGKALLTSCIG